MDLSATVTYLDMQSSVDAAFPAGGRYFASWFDPALDAAAIGWSRSSWDAMAPFATGGVYLNFAGLDDEVGRSAVFGRSAERLDRIRTSYDPNGLFPAAANRP